MIFNNKKVRVYYNGKRQKDMYQTQSKVLLFALHSVSVIKKLVFVSLVFLVGGYILAISFKDTMTYKASAEEVPLFKDNTEHLKDEVVETIKQCESKGHDEEDGIITFDPLVSNPSKTKKQDIPSIGTFQYKASTIVYYYKLLYKKDITTKDAIIIALSDEKAQELTKDIIFKTKNNNGLKEWLNCANKHKLRAQVEIINNK